MSSPDPAVLLAVPDAGERVRILAQEGWDDETALDALVAHAEEHVHDRPADSWTLAELCGTASVDAALQARAAYLMARIAAERGQLEQALDLIQTARQRWSEAGEPLKALRTELGRMQVLDDLGRHGDAIRTGDELLAALDGQESPEEGYVPWLRATTSNNLGVAHSFLGDHVRASEDYRRAEDAYAEAGLDDEAAKTRANRGIELLILGRAREALDVLNDAQAGFERVEDRLWAAKCAGHVAKAHQQLADLMSALRILRDAHRVLADLGAEVEAARLRATTAEVYLAAGLYVEARTEAARAAAFLASLGMVHDCAVATFTEASAALGAGELAGTRDALDRAAALFAQVGDAHHGARVRQLRAELALRSGDPDAARDEAAAAAAALLAGGWSVELAWTSLQQADLAATDAERATHLATASRLSALLRLPALQIALALRVARRCRAHGETAAAEQALRDAIAWSERVGARLTSVEVRPAFRTDHAAVHDELVDLLTTTAADGGSAEDARAALEASYRSKAATLVDVLDGGLGRRRRGEGATRIERARADLSALYHAMSRSEDPALTTRLSRQAADLEQQLTLQQLDADLAQVAVDDPAVRPEPGPGAGRRPAPVLAYHLLEADLVIFLDTGDEVVVRRLPGSRERLEQLLDRLASHWNQFRIGPAFLARHHALMRRTVTDLLGALHQLLVAPVADLLEPLGATGDELVVVPHRRLYEVPFSALHDGTASLVRRWAVVIAPTATTVRGVPTATGEGLLVVGVADEAATSIELEVAALRTAHPGATVLTGDRATAAGLRAALPGPAYVHVACHGLFRASNPMFSALRLHDRWVTAAELTELDFAGALVTLSACETGRAEPGGAEPIGLSWALLLAGARGVVASHWVLDDAAAAQFVPNLYAHLYEGHNSAQSVRRTQLSADAEGSHPYYWAAFSYVAVHGDHPIGASSWPPSPPERWQPSSSPS